MRIAVIGTRGFPGVQGGIEYHCEQLYAHLAESDHEITVFTRKPYVDLNIRYYRGITLIPLDCPKSKFSENIIHSFKAILQARKLKPDILHIHSSFIFAPLARLLGMKTVLTIHCQSYKHKKWRLMAKLFLWLNEVIGVIFASRIITISKPIASALEKQYHRTAFYIPNGISVPELLNTDEILSKLGIEKQRYILYVGRIVAGKGLEDLINAFNLVNYEDWKLVIVGEADHEDKYSMDLKEKARRSKNTILAGFVTGEPLQELYSHAGIFVLPSYYEGLSIVLLEAMSYGLSCIVSDIPANRSVELPDSRFFKVKDVDSLASKIKEFIHKPIDKEEKERQQSLISDKYSWRKIADRTMNIYEQVKSAI